MASVSDELDPFEWYKSQYGIADSQINQQAVGFPAGSSWRDVGLDWADDPKRSANFPLNPGVYQALYDDACVEAGNHPDQVSSAGYAIGSAFAAAVPGIQASMSSFGLSTIESFADPNVPSFLDGLMKQSSSLDSGAGQSRVADHEALATDVLEMYSSVAGYGQETAGQPGAMFDLWLSMLADRASGSDPGQASEDTNALQLLWQFVDAASQTTNVTPGYIFGFPNTSISDAGNVPANYDWSDLPVRFQSLSSSDQLAIAHSLEPPPSGTAPPMDSVVLADGTVQTLSETLTYNTFGPYDPTYAPAAAGAAAWTASKAAEYQSTTEQRNWWYAGAVACAAIYNASGAGTFVVGSPDPTNIPDLFPGVRYSGGGSESRTGTAADCQPGGDPALCAQYCSNAGATDCANCPTTASCIAQYCASAKGQKDCTNCPGSCHTSNGDVTEIVLAATAVVGIGLIFFLYR